MGNVVYRIKENVTMDDFLNNGYDYLTPEMAGLDIMMEFIVYKEIPQRKLSATTRLVVELLNDEDWQQFNLIPEQEKKFQDLGIEFEDVYSENGNLKKSVVENKALFDFAKKWRIEINFTEEDHWLCLTMGDLTFPWSYYNVNLLDIYCKKEIARLKELDLIEEYEVPEDE